MEDPRSVCPLFLAPRDRENFVEQIASGVFLSLGGEMFVLTAAHAVDSLDRGDLLLPGASHLMEFEGTFHRVPLAAIGSRDCDPVDFGFLRLTPELAAQIHPAFKPLEWDELGLTGIETLRRRGALVVPVPLSAEEIARYCRETGQPNTGRTRGQLASKRLAEAILRRESIT